MSIGRMLVGLYHLHTVAHPPAPRHFGRYIIVIFNHHPSGNFNLTIRSRTLSQRLVNDCCDALISAKQIYDLPIELSTDH